MKLPISLQAFELLCSVVFGILLGLHYDFLRVLRRKRTHLTHLLDFWFWLTTLIFGLLFALYVGQGQIHLTFFPVIASGAWLWFLTVSKPFCRSFGWLLHLLFTPIRFVLRFFKKYFRKTAKSVKKYFSIAKKWFMIKNRKVRKNRQCRKGGNANAVSQGIPAGQSGDSRNLSVCYRYPGAPAEADQ